MADIEDLKSRLTKKNGIASTNQYKVVLPGFKGASSKKDLDLLCKEVNMPGKQILTADRQIGIYSEKMVNGFAVEDVSMTFYVLNDYGVKKWFDTWRGRMVGDSRSDAGRGTVGYKKDYVEQIEIHQLRKPVARFGFDLGPLDIDFDVLGASIYSVKLIDAFPTTLSSIQLSNDADGLVEVNIQFSYTNWEVMKDERSLLDLDINLNLGGLI